MSDTDVDRRLTERFAQADLHDDSSTEEVLTAVMGRVRRRRRRRVSAYATIGAAVVVVAAALLAGHRDRSERMVAGAVGAGAASDPVDLLTVGWREGPQLADPQTGNAAPLGPHQGVQWQGWVGPIPRIGNRAFIVQRGRLYSYTAGEDQLRDIGAADGVLANATGDGLYLLRGRELHPADADGRPTGTPSRLPDGYDLTEGQPRAAGRSIVVSRKAGFIGELFTWNPVTGAIHSLGPYNQFIDAHTDAHGTELAFTVCPTGSFPCSLVLSDGDGGHRRTIAPPVQGNGFYLGGAFSPDGRTLATTVSLHPGVSDPDAGLAIVDVRSAMVRMVSGSRFTVGEPIGYATWSPRGTTVFFPAADRAHPDHMRAYKPAEGTLTDLPFPGTYYGAAALPGLDRSHQCPGTESPWQRGAATPNESADGLPPAGTTTQQAAAAVAAQGPGRRVWAEPGRTWTRHPDGSVTVAPEVINTVVVEVNSRGECPTEQTLWSGVPLTFLVARR